MADYSSFAFIKPLAGITFLLIEITLPLVS